INYQDKIGVGGEWYPYAIYDLMAGAPILFLILLIALFLFGFNIKKLKALNWFSFILFVGFLLLTLKSRRYVEYFVPLAVWFSAVTVSPYLKLDTIITKIKNILNYKYYKLALICLAVLFFSFSVPAIVASDFKHNDKDLKRGSSFYRFSAAGKWLEENGKKEGIVLHSDWDEWPLLFFWNSNNYYIVGLDPTFMYNYDVDLYWKWVNITLGKEEDVYNIAKNDFNASYILLEKDHRKMDRNIMKDEQMKMIYEDEEAKIYEVN
ncbi:MAG: hypothetical protein ABID45_00985, partial [Patescibacteria group bacterium]